MHFPPALTYSAFVEGVLGIEDPMPDEIAYKASIERPQYPISLIPVIRKQWLEATEKRGLGRVFAGHVEAGPA